MTATIIKLYLVTALVAIGVTGCSSPPKAGNENTTKSVQEKVVLQHENGQDRHWIMKSGDLIREEHCLSSHGDLHMVLQYSTEVRAPQMNAPQMEKDVRAVCQVYWPNGQLMSKGAMVGGKVNGSDSMWWRNGKLAREAFFEMGAPAGVWKYYDQTGQFVGQGRFLFGGRCHGIFIGNDNPGPDFFIGDGSLKKQVFESGKLIKEEVFQEIVTFRGDEK